MKSFPKAICLFFILVLSTLYTQAQLNKLSVQNLSEINVDEISDADIKSYYQKAQQNGVDDANIYRILSERGLPQIELGKLMQRFQSLGKQEEFDPKQTDKEEEKKKAKTEKQNEAIENNEPPMEKTKKDLAIYGSELFSGKSQVFEPNLRIATPSGYMIGPDDELIVNVFGYSEKTYNLQVNAEGNVYIPQVGPLFLSGLSIEAASQKIKTKLGSTIYKAISSGQTKVQVSLGKIKSIHVTVIGECKKPGTFTVSSLTTLFNMLYLCGGPTDMGSYRKIEVIRGNEVKRVADLYAFLSKGNQKDNILLQEGDLVRIPYYANRIEIDGKVKRKGKYEVVEGETFAQMLQYCGGFSDEAFKAAVTIYQLTESQQRILDLPQEKYNSYQPTSSDRIFVGKILKDFENKLNIRGAVRRPGEYELSEGVTLKELIQKAGGPTQDVFSKRGSIARLSENKMPMHLSFNLDSVLNGLTKVELKKNDSVTIYSIFDLTNEKTVYIDGNIKTPGKYLWAENLTLKDIIITAGGLTESGDFDNIEIARRVQNVDINKSNHIQTEIIKINMDGYNSAKDLSLMPFDVINIRQQPGFTYKRTVFVEGMVKKPGRYTLQMSNERISDIIDRCEGFRANADSSALVIRRLSKKVEKFEDRQKIFTKLLNIKSDSLNQSESIRNEIYKDYDKISIDLNKALQNRDQSENMILEDGDVISIERNTNLVKISGEVYFPTIVPFKKGANLRYYIRKSGSFTQVARKNGTLVIYPDGKAKKVKHFLFIKNYPEVVSRSEIFIPQKTSINRNKISVSEWAVILSSLGIIANVILNFKK